MKKLLAAAAAGCLVWPAAAAVSAAAGPVAGATTAPSATTGLSATNGPSVSTGPCGTMPVSSTSYTHVLWVWMENHSYSTIIGSSQAPYINKLANRCGLATNYHNITHPSLPNYIAGTSGLARSALGRFASDCNPTGPCTTSAPSIFGQGESWKAYEDSMPANCTRADAGEYAVRHDPPPYYTSLGGCGTNDVPYTALATDLARDRLPAFSFVTPNLIHDMHDGSVAQGDAWLSKNLPTIFASGLYTSGKLVVFVTWDEGEGGSSNNCATNTTDVGCHVATMVVSPSTTPGTRSASLFSHYSELRTTEQLLGLPFLGEAATATSMKSAFRL